MRHTGLALALAFAGGPLAAQQTLDTAALHTVGPQVVQSGPRTRLRSTEPNIAPLWARDAFVGGPLTVPQPPDSATLARVRAVLHHDLFAVAAWPIVSVEVRTNPPYFDDTVVVVQQRQDTVTLELTEAWSPWVAFAGPLQECREWRHDGAQELAMNDCSSPRPYQIIEHVWLRLRGPLPGRARGELLYHLVRVTWGPARLRPN